MTESDFVLDTEGAAKFLGAHVETLRRLARRGEIPSFKLGREWRFRTSDLNHWIETHHLRARAPKVLVVDDDARTRSALRLMLEKHNYSVSEAKSAAEALDFLKQVIPDVVLLDLELPEKGGPEVLREIRESYESSAVVIITDDPDGDLVKRALRHAPLIMVPKQVGVKELLLALRQALVSVQLAMDNTAKTSMGNHSAVGEENPSQEVVLKRGES